MSNFDDAYAVLIGIDRYRFSPGDDLDGPATDAGRMHDMLVRAGLSSSRIKTIKVERAGTTDLAAETDALHRFLDSELPEIKAKNLIFYWSGHGFEHATDQWLCYPEASQDELRALNFRESLFARLGGDGFGFANQYFFVDACRSPYPVPGGPRVRDFALRGEPAGHRQHAILASPSGAITPNLPAEQTGAFSKALLEILGGLEFPWDMAAVWDGLQRAGLPPITIDAIAPDGGRKTYDLGRGAGPGLPSVPPEQVHEMLVRLGEPCRWLPGDILRQARRTTLGIFAPHLEVDVPASATGLARIAEFLFRLGEEEGLKMVLDFLERVAAALTEDPAAGTIRAACDELVRDHPAERSVLEKRRKAVADHGVTRPSRPHVLVQVRHSQEYDLDRDSAGQLFEVTVWQYRDEWDLSGPEVVASPSENADCLLANQEPVGAALARTVLDALIRPPEPGTIVELMLADLTLSERALATLFTELGRKYTVVLRPDTPAGTADWFANWRRVLNRAAFTRSGPRGKLPPGCVAVAFTEPPREAGIFETLRNAGIPVAVWARRRPAMPYCDYQTPSELARSRPVPTLMWHNPHWFPDEQGGLSWRDEATA